MHPEDQKIHRPKRLALVDFLSYGQRLAIEQLTEIADRSKGQLSLVEIAYPKEDEKNVRLRLSVSTGHYKVTSEGLDFRKRESIVLIVSQEFPFIIPKAYFMHRRFIGKPHVQWGCYICLYQSPEMEWVASDGMYGFVQRLNDWLRAAALDELDPDDAPLHPPVVYTSSKFKFVARANTPEIEEYSKFWLGAVHLSKRNLICFDLERWSRLGEEYPEEAYLAAAILLNSPMPMEYPTTVSVLVDTLTAHGLCFSLLSLWLWKHAIRLSIGQDLFLILGAPMRRLAAGEPLKQHLTAWRIPAEAVDNLKKAIGNANGDLKKNEATRAFAKWIVTAKTEWCTVYENREEVTTRRDIDTSVNWLNEKRVLLLGCGAIGSHIAESIARASPKKLVLVDKNTVSAGVLVRQAFRAFDVGFPKSRALAVRMKELKLAAEIDGYNEDLRNGVFTRFDSTEFDLVIDATASRSVNLVIERELFAKDIKCPIVSCAISRNAEFGRIIVRMPDHKYGMHSALRGVKIRAFGTPSLADCADAFWPSALEETHFQPEPGCSEPTFVASNADAAWYAASFINAAVQRIQMLNADQVEASFFKPECNLPRVTVSNPEQYTDAVNDFSVLLSPAAKKAIQAEINRNARSGNKLDETGGLLFGEIDNSLQKVWIDFASGPPPDSVKCSKLFLCGISGTKELNTRYDNETRGSTKFVGVWHTHPVSLPDPSVVDLSAMTKILCVQKESPRHATMLIVGRASTEPAWRFHHFKRKRFRISDEIA